MAERAADRLPVLHTRHRRPLQARRADRPPPALLRAREVLRQAPLPADARLPPLGAQIRAGARRARGGDPPQRRPERPAPVASTPSPPRKPGSSSPQPRGTGSPPCSSSPCAPDSARANSCACTEKTSISTAAPPASAVPFSALGLAASPPCRPRRSARNAASPSRPPASPRSTSTVTDRPARSSGPAQTGWTTASLSLAWTATPSNPPPSRGTSRHCSGTPACGRSGSTTSATRPRPSSWNRASNSSSSRNCWDAHIGVTATVYAHVRLRLQRDAIGLLNHVLSRPSEAAAEPDDDDPLHCAAPVH